MKFTDLLNSQITEEVSLPEKSHSPKPEMILVEGNSPEELLREEGLKIKLVVPTAFGTQIDFAKKYEGAVIEKILSDFTIKIKDKSVFVVD